ncbi:MAG: hypothetical protein IPJ34_33670 [Myxococcales bacterium]|nr:hypothetical protein [Myxococcales bacterium]
MSGFDLKIIPPTTYDLTKLSGNINDAMLIPIAQRIDVSRYEYGQIVTRVHSVNIAANNQLWLFAAGDGFTLDDPTLDWSAYNTNLATPVGGTVGTLVYDNNTAAPSQTAMAFNTQSYAPDLITIFARGLRAAANTGSLSIRISIDLVVRSGGQGGMRPGSYMGYGGRAIQA